MMKCRSVPGRMESRGEERGDGRGRGEVGGFRICNLLVVCRIGVPAIGGVDFPLLGTAAGCLIPQKFGTWASCSKCKGPGGPPPLLSRTEGRDEQGAGQPG